MDTWLIYNLTGGAKGGAFATDVSNAARTNLMDIRSCQWHPQTCHAFGLQTDMLPEIKSNAEVFGHVKEGPLKGAQPIKHCVLYSQLPSSAGIKSSNGNTVHL